ncbi:hypothetical protein [Roseovarius spongiae]|uniref:hypothetical protein n=1 Tax=Roseovarius spongiae TaxID=2320272 RepID=UPI0011C44002|nr:hypothetical protein [Roseovarius spongiae]
MGIFIRKKQHFRLNPNPAGAATSSHAHPPPISAKARFKLLQIGNFLPLGGIQPCFDDVCGGNS